MTSHKTNGKLIFPRR